MLWHTVSSIKCQGLRKISYVESRIIKCNLQHCPSKCPNLIGTLLMLNLYYYHLIGQKSLRTSKYFSSSQTEQLKQRFHSGEKTSYFHQNILLPNKYTTLRSLSGDGTTRLLLFLCICVGKMGKRWYVDLQKDKVEADYALEGGIQRDIWCLVSTVSTCQQQ